MIAGVFLLVGVSITHADTRELLTSPWHFTMNNSASEKYGPTVGSMASTTSVSVTYDLHGTCILGGDASAIIFDQNGWKYASLSNYGTNCLNGSQTATIPVSAFGLSTSSPVGTVHARFWYGSAATVDITSVVLNSPTAPPPPPPPPVATSTTWAIQSVDVMKYSKDVVCNQPSQATIDNMVQKAVDLGANYVAVSSYYDNPSCGSSLTLTQKWVSSIRSHGLKVWFRMKDLKFEGDYSQAKTFNPDGMRHQKLMVDWIANNNLVQNGDIFTPNAEPQNGGINGVTWCGSPANCQFTGKDDFNIWLKQVQTLSDLAFKAKGLASVKVGYYGFDGFVAAGLGNPDWQGQSQLYASTIAMMGNVAIDHYPETIGHTLAQDLPTIKQAIGATTPIIISEYGSITSAPATTSITSFMTAAAAEPNIQGFNYWTLGPSGNEALINSDFTNRPGFDVVKSFYIH